VQPGPRCSPARRLEGALHTARMMIRSRPGARQGQGPGPGVDREVAVSAVVASFVGARVQASGPIRVEEQLRDTFRARTDRRP
jgi:hypothetical protein